VYPPPPFSVRPEGWPFIGTGIVVAALLFLVSAWAGWIVVLLTIWCVFFFRDPERITPIGPGLVVSPADGVIQNVDRAVPPPELGMGEVPMKRVGIFMNVFDCHVNRSPVEASVLLMSHRPGKFVNASFDKASEDNERLSLRLALEDGGEIAVVQIAGLIARRIICWAKEDERLRAGQRFGMIRFGSRVDVYLPAATTRLLVARGQRAIAGETVLAELGSPAPDRGGEAR
jgi:phosphatidylserine decarboxylase